MVRLEDLEDLPAFDHIRRGLEDLRARRPSASAWLCQIARPRLQQAGLWPADLQPLPGESELELYRLLCRTEADPYGRYNALLRELLSFEQILDHHLRRLHHRDPENTLRETAETEKPL